MHSDQRQVEQAILSRCLRLTRLRADNRDAIQLRSEIKREAVRWLSMVPLPSGGEELDRYPRHLAERRLEVAPAELDRLIDWELLPAYNEDSEVSKVVVEALEGPNSLWWRGLLKLRP